MLHSQERGHAGAVGRAGKVGRGGGDVEVRGYRAIFRRSARMPVVEPAAADDFGVAAGRAGGVDLGLTIRGGLGWAIPVRGPFGAADAHGLGTAWGDRKR